MQFMKTNYHMHDVLRIFGKVKMQDGTEYRGFVYAHRGQRLQDLLNDGRDFIPIELVKDYHADTGTIGHVLISKRFIISFEEIRVNKENTPNNPDI
jgi:hypothetical protein